MELGKTPELRRKQLDELREEIRGLHAVEEPSEEQATRMEAAMGEWETVETAVAADETRAAKVAKVFERKTETAPGHDAPAQINRRSPFDVDVRSASRGELRDAALRVTEERGKHLSNAQQAGLEDLLGRNGGGLDGSVIARRLIVTESDDYRSGFMKAITHSVPAFTPEESRALNEYRAASEGTTTAGGFGVPVLIDPSILISSGASVAPIYDLATKKLITTPTNVWKGVSSAPAAWSYDAEANEVSDDATTLAQPAITVYMSRGFIPYSIELEQDYAGFGDEFGGLLREGFFDLMASQTATGSGSAPKGLFTAMNNETVSPAHKAVTTIGALGAVDIRNIWATLPERFRANATWVMSANVQMQIQGFNSAGLGSDYTVNLTADGVPQLVGRPVRVTDYAPSYTNTTASQQVLVVGDLSKFIVVQRAGLTVEPVPFLTGSSGRRPTGQRGLFAYARVGHDMGVLNAARILTSA